jgi:hypothetical protein
VAKQKDPSAKQLEMIKTRFRRIRDGKVEFFAEPELRAWYGLYNSKVVDKLSATYESVATMDWSAPKLTVVRIDRPKGYALGLQENQKEWTWRFGSRR